MTGTTPDRPVPVFQEYMNAILSVLRTSQSALFIEELDRRAIEAMALPTDVAQVPHDPARPDRTEVAYRMAWARTYLKKANLLANPARGMWALTEQGRSAGTIDAYAVASSIAQARDASGLSDFETEEFLDGLEDDSDDVVGQLERELRALHQRLAVDGRLLDPQKAARCYALFRERFGPRVLIGLDGEALLETMHARGTHDSLVYWLEFKNDDELPAVFGSIAGGSALKFGIYQSANTKLWMAGTAQAQLQLSVEDAVAMARRQRDQLVAGARVLEQASTQSVVDHRRLQQAIEDVAPDVAESSWGHKYFALLFPDLLEPFHGADYQTHQLHKLLKVEGRGRYENARVFRAVAQQLGISLLELSEVLHERNGSPHGYWTVAANEPTWESMRRGGHASLGWPNVGSLADLTYDKTSREALRQRVGATYPSDASKSIAKQLLDWATLAGERDLVAVVVGSMVRAVGRIVGSYSFEPEDVARPHHRAVEWLAVGDWALPETEGSVGDLCPVRKTPNILRLEASLLEGNGERPAAVPVDPPVVPVLTPLTGTVARIQAVLLRKRQVILHGPPGTGKTYWAERAVEELVARGWFGVDAASLGPERRTELVSAGAVELCSFHPAYGYEDFLEGYRPYEHNGALAFELRPGVFKRLCARARTAPNKPFYLVIDEINRGDIPRIFGELLTVLERDKRGRSITLPISGESFSVPDNVFVLGTMNTTDRSIALLDAALRRRFGFIELLPDARTLGAASAGGLPLGPWLDELNRRIVKHVRGARHLQVGHSYLLPGGTAVRDVARFSEILRDDIVPLLEEYCYEDFDALAKILGDRIVDSARRRIDATLFEAPRHGDLVQALLSSFDQLTTTQQAVLAEADAEADAP